MSVTAVAAASQVIDACNTVSWTGSGGVSVTTDATEKMEGSSSLSFSFTLGSTGTATRVFAPALRDFSKFVAGSPTTVDDLIHVWVRVDHPERVIEMSLAFDAAGGDFATKTFTRAIASTDLLGPEQWTELWLPLSSFLEGGGATNGAAGTANDWATIAAIRLTVQTSSAGGVLVHLDDIKLSGGSGPDGTYTWKYAYKNSTSQHQSNPSPASNALILHRQAALLPAIAAPSDSQVDRIVWYRQGGAIADYELVGEVAVNTTLTDTLKDTDLLNILETDNDPPPPLRMIWEHLNCAFGIETNCQEMIAWSKRWRPESFPPANTLIVTHKGEPLQAGVSWNGLAYVWSDQRLFRILASEQSNPATGASLLVLTAQLVEGAPGTLDPRSVQVTPSGIVYRGQDGLYVFDGSRAQRMSDKAEPLFRGAAIAPYHALAADRTDQPTARAVQHRGEYWISYPTGLQEANAETQVWDLVRGRLRGILPVGFDALWSEWDQDIVASMSDQTVYLLEQGTDDAGAAIALDVETAFQALDSGAAKPVQALLVEADAGGATLTITVAKNGLVPSLPATPSVSATFGPGRTRRFFKVFGSAQEAAIQVTGNVSQFTLYRAALGDNVLQLKRWADREA